MQCGAVLLAARPRPPHERGADLGGSSVQGMADPGAAVLAGLAPFRANRRPGFAAGGRLPGEPPYGAADRAPAWMESLIRLALHALWAGAAAAGGAQIMPRDVGGAPHEVQESPQVARMLQRLEAVLAEVQRDAGKLDGTQSMWTYVKWESATVMAASLLCLLYIAYKFSRRLYAANTVGGRARILMDLSVALDRGGHGAAEQLAEAAGVPPKAVHDWQAAWKLAWRGPG